jgi:hypothetical protein
MVCQLDTTTTVDGVCGGWARAQRGPSHTHLFTQIRAGHVNDMWPDHAVAKPSGPGVLLTNPDCAGALPGVAGVTRKW